MSNPVCHARRRGIFARDNDRLQEVPRRALPGRLPAVLLPYLPLLLWLMLAPRTVWPQGYSLAEAADKMTVAEGLSVTLFAGEPQVRQPIFCKCDERGRLWTIQYLQYPNPAGLERVEVDRYSRTVYDRKPKPPPHGPRGADRITILEDTDGDGRADRFRDFVTGLNLCTGVEFGYGGVFVIQAPYLLFYPDRDRDDVPDGDPEVLLDGFGLEDAQSLANHLTWGPDGWLYGLNGSTTTCRIRGIEFQQGVWRYHPVSREFELFCEGGGNVYGLTFDRQGRLFYSSNGGVFYHGVQGAYYEKNFGKHGPLHNPHAYGYFSHVETTGRTGRPNTGATMYLGRSFPGKFHDTMLLGDFLTHTCSWWKIGPRGSTVSAVLGGHWLDARDSWFGATDVCLGPAGEVYVCDFHDRRTAHPDPDAEWDRSNGRIYRIQGASAKQARRFDLQNRTTTELIELLRDPNGWYAQQARRLLAERRDDAAGPTLRRLASQEEDGQVALQALWAAHASGASTPALAAACLGHSSEHVRAWTVRLLGDGKRIPTELTARVMELAKTDPSVIVRAQLAATAKRLPAEQAIPMIRTLLSRDLDDDDPHLPWLLWWALEDKAVSARARVLTEFARPRLWTIGSFRGNLRRLMRRYAAEGTAEGYAACASLWDAVPQDERPPVLGAVLEGLRERSRQTPPAPVGGALRRAIHDAWHSAPKDPLRTRLALEAGLEPAYSSVIEALRTADSAERLTGLLELLARYGREDCVAAVLPLARSPRPAEVRAAALAVLARFADARITAAIVEDYGQMPPALRADARGVLFRRPGSSREFLQRLGRPGFDPAGVSLDELRPLAVFNDPAVDALVRQHWGSVRPATAEVKLADVRRFNNDLRAASGNREAGERVFQKQCGTCHPPLDGQAPSETPLPGPDLSGTVKGDRTSLLTSIVDPSAVIRREYLSYVVVDAGGGVHTGVLVEQDPGSVTLADAQNRRLRLRRDEIERMEASALSLMPEKLLDPLTPRQRRDLFAYLQNAGPRKGQ